eukprot:Awhi_evm1s5304
MNKNRFIPYYGNKRKEINYITKHLPEKFKVFVDVFGGSGSVGISVKDVCMCDIVYNDFNDKLMRLLKIFKSDDLESEIKDFNNKLIYNHNTQEDCIKHLDNVYDSLDNDELKFLMKCLFSIMSLYLTTNTELWGVRCDKRLKKTSHTINVSRIHYEKYHYTYFKLDEIHNKEYKEILEMYKDNKDAVLYLDPPYIKKRKIRYNGDDFNLDSIDYIKKYMKECKCKVMINPDYDERYLDEEFNLKEVYDKTYDTVERRLKSCNGCRERQKVIREKYKCIHNRKGSDCKECVGRGLCIHRRIRGTCKECGGSQICIHNKRRSQCKECGGSSICDHNKRRNICKECDGSDICMHHKRRSYCKDCMTPKEQIKFTLKNMIHHSKEGDIKKDRYDANNFIDICFLEMTYEELVENGMECYYYGDCKNTLELNPKQDGRVKPDTLITIERLNNDMGHIKSNCVFA